MLKSGHAFAEDISNFVEQLLCLLAATSIISDDCFLKILTDFLMVCSDSKVRPFRHTTTLIGKLEILANSIKSSLSNTYPLQL